MDKEEISKRLDDLRVEWKERPIMRKIIEARARALKNALSLIEEKKDDIVDYAKKIFQ